MEHGCLSRVRSFFAPSAAGNVFRRAVLRLLGEGPHISSHCGDHDRVGRFYRAQRCVLSEEFTKMTVPQQFAGADVVSNASLLRLGNDAALPSRWASRPPFVAIAGKTMESRIETFALSLCLILPRG